MPAPRVKAANDTAEALCKAEIERMLKNSQTKVIMPVVAVGLLKEYSSTGTRLFSDAEIRKAYHSAVRDLKQFLGHDVHIGAKYEDAYGMRMFSYGVLKSIGHLKYKLLSPYTDCAESLSRWIPLRLKEHIEERLGIVPLLQNVAKDMSRLALSALGLVEIGVATVFDGGAGEADAGPDGGVAEVDSAYVHAQLFVEGGGVGAKSADQLV
jgi:hypothetical protein